MRSFCILAIILSTNLCFAQKALNEHPKRFIFGYDYGASLPKGDFAKSDVTKLPMSRLYNQDTNKLNGYAKHGFHYDIYFTYKFLRHFGITAAVSGDQDSYDINTLNTEFIAKFPPNTVAVSSGDNYVITQYLVGPYVNITPVPRLDIELRALVGYTTANYPTADYLGFSTIQVYTTAPSSAFGYNAGLGIKFMAEEVKEIGLALHLNVNYQATNISYSSYSITYYTLSNNYINSYTYNVPKTMPINILQATLGISLEF